MQLPGTWTYLLVSLWIHVALISYANHIDTHPEQYGGLKYTDVDWRVVIDGVRHIFYEGSDSKAAAQGWLNQALNLGIGDPYARATFRYTPLLPLLLSPSLIHPLLGRLLLTCLSLLVSVVLLSTRGLASRNSTHLLWTFNPLVINITTRGSPEAIVILLVISTLACLHQSASSGDHSNWSRKWESIAAVVLALAISWKIYPIIYIPSIWAFLAQKHGWLGWPIWRFGFYTGITLLVVNIPLWLIWGQPFLEHTFLYHLHRLDHRHNFSPYYYPIYLSLFSRENVNYGSTNTTDLDSSMMMLQRAIRNPLASFIPQFGLVTLIGLYLTRRTSLAFAMFLQTATFVVFNKVCTSQYFTWFIPFVPCVIPHLRMPTRRAVVLVGAWIGAQALWLGTAYHLELQAKSVHLQLWIAGVVLFSVSAWVICELLESWEPGESVRRLKTE